VPRIRRRPRRPETTLADPIYSDRLVDLYPCEALRFLDSLPDESIDLVLTDAPYSSGGLTRSDRHASPRAKYVQTGTRRPHPNFSGDGRDGRGWLHWCTLWITQCHRVLRPHGYILMFTDWRQLPTATDALQAGGLIWRGLIVWDKTDCARAPHKGYYRHQAEYVVWGTKGVSKPATHGGPWRGVYRYPVRQRDKHHMTGKPTPLCRDLVQCVPAGAVVLDPLAGSGTTLIAAALECRQAIGCEYDPVIAEGAVDRLRRELAG